MRLVCPNCGAQYEVPDAVIPESGRDVQCSNCGDTWFQNHPDHDPGLTEEPGDAATDRYHDASSGAEATDHEATGPEEPQVPQESVSEARDAPPVAQPRKRELDPSVTDVLREEAAREEEERKRESATLEEQPDLGLQQPEKEVERRQREARDRMAKMRGADPEPEQATRTAKAPPRRDVLPDVDEINSTLRKDSERRKTATQAAQEREAQTKPGGSRRGFAIVLLIAVIALLVYIFAPQISEAVPALAPYMESYVLAVNDGRIWLDEKIRGLVSMLDGMASDAPASEPAE